MTDGRAVHGLPWDTNTQYIGLLRIASEHDERAATQYRVHSLLVILKPHRQRGQTPSELNIRITKYF